MTIGHSPPDGIIWAHSRHDFYDVNGEKWSRSMILEAVNTGKMEAAEAERLMGNLEPGLLPELIKPWSILSFKSDAAESALIESEADMFKNLKIDGDDSTTEIITTTHSSTDTKTEEIACSKPPHPYYEIPKLEEPIPLAHLPYIVLLKDPDRRCAAISAKSTDSTPILRFVRIYPEPDHSAEQHVAHLDLSSAPWIGTGSHAHVFRGLFRPPSTLSVASRTGEATVAVKVSFDNAEDREMLHIEARTYASLPTYLSEDWSGYHHIAELESYTRDGIAPVSAVVPRYYGTYALDDETCVLKRNPMFSLFEECGRPICSYKLTQSEKVEVAALGFRLHRANVIQGSFYDRNILVQPGPLFLPPGERSGETPSFRIIDFGRAEFLPKRKESVSSWKTERFREIRHIDNMWHY